MTELVGGNRQTGRTTRMLKAAIASAAEGNWVTVIGGSYMESNRLRKSAMMIASQDGLYIAKEEITGFRLLRSGSMQFYSEGYPSFEWETLQVRAVDGMVFIDHHAVELRREQLQAAVRLLEEQLRMAKELEGRFRNTIDRGAFDYN